MSVVQSGAKPITIELKKEGEDEEEEQYDQLDGEDDEGGEFRSSPLEQEKTEK
jgi:hypothetical protein